MSTFGRVVRIILLVFFAIDVLGLFIVLVTSAYAQSLPWQKALIIIAFIFCVLGLSYQILCLARDEHVILDRLTGGFSGGFDADTWKTIGIVALAIVFLPITILVGIGYLIFKLIDHLSKGSSKTKSNRKKSYTTFPTKEAHLPRNFFEKGYAVYLYRRYLTADSVPNRGEGKYNRNATMPYSGDLVSYKYSKELLWYAGQDIVLHKEKEKAFKRAEKGQERIKKNLEKKEAYKRKMIAKLDYYEKHKKMKKYYELRDWCWDHGIIEMPPHLKKMREEWAAERRAEREKERKEHEEWLKRQREKERRLKEVQKDEKGQIIYPDADDVENYVSSVNHVYSGCIHGDIDHISVSGYGGRYSIQFEITISADFGGLEGEISSSDVSYLINEAKGEFIRKAKSMASVNQVSVQCVKYYVDR